MARSVDPWDEVWDAYEARKMAPALAGVAVLTTTPPPVSQSRPAAAEVPAGRRWLRPLALAAVFTLGCAAGSAWPILNLYALVARQDAPGLLRQLDLAPAQEGLRQALRTHAGLQGPPATAAERLLAGMADDMAASLARPGALEGLALARREGPWPQRDPAVPPLQRLRPGGWGMASVEWGPAEGQGGFGLELARGATGWQAVSVRLLDAPVMEGAGRAPESGFQAALAAPRRPG